MILGLGLRGRRTISSGEERPSEEKRFAAVWGNGDYGRLGLGSLESRWRPAFCSAFGNESLRGIACGGAHTLFLTGFSIASNVLYRYTGLVLFSICLLLILASCPFLHSTGMEKKMSGNFFPVVLCGSACMVLRVYSILSQNVRKNYTTIEIRKKQRRYVSSKNKVHTCYVIDRT